MPVNHRAVLIAIVLSSATAVAARADPAELCAKPVYNEGSLLVGGPMPPQIVNEEAWPPAVLRVAMGMTMGTCRGDERGTMVRVGVLGQLVKPRNIGNGVGAELEISTPLPDRNARVGIRTSLGAGTSLWTSIGVRIRHTRLSFGVDVLYSTGTYAYYVDGPGVKIRPHTLSVVAGFGLKLGGTKKQWLGGTFVTAVAVTALVVVGLSQIGT